ncbi:hypothetical protein CYMTET_52642 [Cymbomonas tetramitiformis]|uniref:Uncharacterized protein n=1 Tax=Cymbomonas tetramitiformis TaxID=36881 RepID=A0AAE0BK17_9CHLO|nr:hypothetical protein CYMTET_52642 [Cymbomonas tetramitiformis]
MQLSSSVATSDATSRKKGLWDPGDIRGLVVLLERYWKTPASQAFLKIARWYIYGSGDNTGSGLEPQALQTLRDDLATFSEKWLNIKADAFTALAELAAGTKVQLEFLSKALDLNVSELRCYLQTTAIRTDAILLPSAVEQLVELLGREPQISNFMFGLSSTVYGNNLIDEQEAALRHMHKPEAAAIWVACLHSTSERAPLTVHDMRSVVLALKSPKQRVLMEIAAVAISGTSATANMLPNISLLLGVPRHAVLHFGLCVLLFADNERLHFEVRGCILDAKKAKSFKDVVKQAEICRRMWRTMMMLPGSHQERANRLAEMSKEETVQSLRSAGLKVGSFGSKCQSAKPLLGHWEVEGNSEELLTERNATGGSNQKVVPASDEKSLEGPPTDAELQRVISKSCPNHLHQQAVLGLAHIASGQPTEEAMSNLAGLLQLDKETISLLVDLTMGDFLRVLGFQGPRHGIIEKRKKRLSISEQKVQAIGDSKALRSKNTGLKANSADMAHNHFWQLPAEQVLSLCRIERLKLLTLVTGLPHLKVITTVQQARRCCQWGEARNDFIKHMAQALNINRRSMLTLIQACGIQRPSAGLGKPKGTQILGGGAVGRAQRMLSALHNIFTDASGTQDTFFSIVKEVKRKAASQKEVNPPTLLGAAQVVGCAMHPTCRCALQLLSSEYVSGERRMLLVTCWGLAGVLAVNGHLQPWLRKPGDVHFGICRRHAKE